MRVTVEECEFQVARKIDYNSVLSLAHFADAEFANDCRDIFQYLDRAKSRFPLGHENAKIWETVQGWRALRDLNALGDNAEVLGVGAGAEPLIFWLTNHAKRVFATDLYAARDGWQEADASMLASPGDLCPPAMPFNERRLVVQHMNAMSLKYEDNSFAAVFSCGSVEHFGKLENVTKAATEMGRVLKPGGILSLATEFRLSGPAGTGIPGVILFTPEMLERYIIKPSGLTPVDKLRVGATDVAPYAYPLAEAVHHGIRPRSICLSQDGYVWTSVSLCLRKEI